MHLPRLFKLGLALSGLLGCIEPAPLSHRGEPRRPRDNPQPSTPSPSPSPSPSSSGVTSMPSTMPSVPTQVAASADGLVPAGAIFGNALQVMAYKIEPPMASPGATVRVTLSLRVLNAIADDEMMFVHIDDAEGRSERVNGDHWPANHRTPMNQWKKGDMVTDQFSFTLGGFSESRAAHIWLGFWEPNRDERLPITNPGQVKNDGNNRYLLAEVPITH